MPGDPESRKYIRTLDSRLRGNDDCVGFRYHFKRFILLAVIAIAFGITGFAGAEQSKLQSIDTQALREMMSAGGVTLINVSGLLACMDSRIPGSLCLTCDEDKDKDKAVFSSLAKDSAIIFYGGGAPVDPACNLIAEADRRGFVNIRIFTGGLPAWRRAGYAIESLRHVPRIDSLAISPRYFTAWKQQAKNPLIIDIRPADLYQKNHLEGAVNIPLTGLHRLYQNIPQDRSLLVVDENGAQSFLAASYLARKGFLDIKRLAGGMVSFQRGKK
jgi:rhodanese-related sulfurtransferase